MVVRGGIVQAIDNCSGHYMPNWKNLFQAVEIFDRHRVFESNATVGYVLDADCTMFFSVLDFLRLGRLDFAPAAVVKTLCGYQQTYRDKPPMHPSKTQSIPRQLLSGWHSRDGNKYDIFVKRALPKFVEWRPGRLSVEAQAEANLEPKAS